MKEKSKHSKSSEGDSSKNKYPIRTIDTDTGYVCPVFELNDRKRGVRLVKLQFMLAEAMERGEDPNPVLDKLAEMGLDYRNARALDGSDRKISNKDIRNWAGQFMALTGIIKEEIDSADIEDDEQSVAYQETSNGISPLTIQETICRYYESVIEENPYQTDEARLLPQGAINGYLAASFNTEWPDGDHRIPDPFRFDVDCFDFDLPTDADIAAAIVNVMIGAGYNVSTEDGSLILRQDMVNIVLSDADVYRFTYGALKEYIDAGKFEDKQLCLQVLTNDFIQCVVRAIKNLTSDDAIE
jgi:hypothetical protein